MSEQRQVGRSRWDPERLSAERWARLKADEVARREGRARAAAATHVSDATKAMWERQWRADEMHARLEAENLMREDRQRQAAVAANTFRAGGARRPRGRNQQQREGAR